MNDEATESAEFEPTMLYHDGHLPGEEHGNNPKFGDYSCKVFHTAEDLAEARKDGWVEHPEKTVKATAKK